jgi:hypothetical protein
LSMPTPNQIKDANEEFWRWIFREDDNSDHPLKRSNNRTAQIQRDSLLIVAGSLPDNMQRNRLLQILSGIEYVFVPAENCVYTEADNDGQTDQVLIDKANQDMLDSKAKVLVNNVQQPINRLPGHTFSPALDIQKCISGTGKSGRGEGCNSGGPPGPTRAAAACDYAIIRANTLRSRDTIKIEGIGRAAPNQAVGHIDVTYRVQ